MTDAIVECVPNFSEGRDRKKIDLIAAAAASVDGVEVLDVDPGYETNRTVCTFVGSPDATVEAAFRLIAKAAELIDMSTQSGAHARHGATDVCPFVPVAGVTMDDCVELAKALGRRVGDELGIPVYLYDQAAQIPERRSLAKVRAGEYEALPDKLGRPEWKPDFGPAEFIPKTGVITIGAREFLIAYNVNLNSGNKAHATDLAFEIREKGRAVRMDQTTPYYSSGKLLKYKPSTGRFPCGRCFDNFGNLQDLVDHTRERHEADLLAELAFFGRDAGDLEDKNVMRLGRFRECRAVGWLIPEYDRAQISINLTNYKVTSTHDVVEICRELATARGLVVTGSEVVGLIPYDAIRQSGEFYLERQGSSRGLPVKDVVECAVQSLGLRDVAPFDAESAVLGLPKVAGPLATMKVDELADEVSRPSPAPGGGSIAAMAGSLGAALSAMVANLAHAKPPTLTSRGSLERIAMRSQALKDDLLRAIDADTDAFNDVITAMRLPKSTTDEKAARTIAIQDGYKHATRVPLGTAELCLETIALCREVSALGLPASVTDAGVGALMGYAGLEGAIMNVRVNLNEITDAAWVKETSSTLDRMLKDGEAQVAATRAQVEKLIGG